MEALPEELCEIHCLGPKTREWLVTARQVPAFRSTHTRIAGFTVARAGYRFVRHDPIFSQVLACVGGAGRVLVDGRWEPCTAGMAYLNAPHALCAYQALSSGRWQICWVLYEEKNRLPGLDPGTPPRLVQTDARGLHLVIESICQEAAGAAESAMLDLGAALLHRQATRAIDAASGLTQLGLFWQQVRRDLGGDWTLDRLALSAGMSKEALRRHCLAELGEPPLAQLTRLRMQCAADLIVTTQDKIGSIARRVGYGDPFAFSNAFKRVMGRPPSRYRKSSAAF